MLEDQTVEIAEIFHLLGDPTRLRVITCCLHEPRNVSEIAETVGVSASLVSHHLRLLRAARLVRAERRGKQVFYVAADQHVQRILKDMMDHVAEPDHEDA